MQVNDGSTLSGLQVVVNLECEGYSLIDDGQVATGASVAVIGELTESPGGRQKVRPQSPPTKAFDLLYAHQTQHWQSHNLTTLACPTQLLSFSSRMCQVQA